MYVESHSILFIVTSSYRNRFVLLGKQIKPEEKRIERKQEELLKDRHNKMGKGKLLCLQVTKSW